jgi:transcriptional regulator with XRE-family HTH domain
MAKNKNEWIREGLEKRGYTQRDLAKTWAVSDGLVTRFIQGTEGQRLFLDRAWLLASMLGISVDELARGLGVTGKPMPPAIEEAA